MTPKNHSLFRPFRFDWRDDCLWRGRQRVALTRKAFAVLRYLMEYAGEVVTTGELLDAVWPDVSVSEGVRKCCMHEIRKALGDDAQATRFIETLHRRGYRFMAPVAASAAPVPSFKFQVSSPPPHQSLAPTT